MCIKLATSFWNFWLFPCVCKAITFHPFLTWTRSISYSGKIWRALNLAKWLKKAKIKYWRNFNLAILIATYVWRNQYRKTWRGLELQERMNWSWRRLRLKRMIWENGDACGWKPCSEPSCFYPLPGTVDLCAWVLRIKSCLIIGQNLNWRFFLQFAKPPN